MFSQSTRLLACVIIAAVAGLALQAIAGTADEVADLIEDFADENATIWRTAYAEVVEIGKPAIPYLADALKDKRQKVRWISVQVLGAIGGPEAVPPLLAALKDEYKDVRRYTVVFLGRWGANNADVVPAVTRLLHDPNPEVVWHAMQALDELGQASYKRDEHLVDSLCQHLEHPDRDRRENAAKALGMIGSSRACPALVKALAYPESTGSHRNAIGHALAKIDSREAVPLLLELFTDETAENGVRYSAASTLRELADPTITVILLPYTYSADRRIRSSAVNALGFKDNTRAVGRLAKIAEDKSENSSTRETAVAALGRIGDPDAVDSIIQALADGEYSVRRRAARALGKIGSPRAVPALIEAVKDANSSVVKHAATSLGNMGDNRAALAIVQLFDRKDALKVTASSMPFANVAIVAHRALVAIVGEDPTGEKLLSIRNEDQLNAVREAWRVKLRLDEEEKPGDAPGKPEPQTLRDIASELAASAGD